MATEEYYTPTGVPSTGSDGDSDLVRNEFTAIKDGISEKLPDLTGKNNYPTFVNSGATGLESKTPSEARTLLDVYSKDEVDFVITPNTENITQNTTDIATNTADIDTNTADIATSIATSTADIAANTADIAANTADIAVNTVDIAINNSYISQNATDITSLGTLVGGGVLGVGQTWQDVLASRSDGVVYTNNTGKPIMVSVRVRNEGTVGGNIKVDGVTAINVLDRYAATWIAVPLITVVPAGSTYEVSVTYGSIDMWSELR